jgi:exosome complex component RRP4
VVGRVSAVDSKRWRVDLNGQKDAILQLSSVNLPGGVQRMRTYEDQLQMRTLFAENDVVCAEVQNINSDGILSLHSRSMKYGKMENGQLVRVPSSLMKRLPQHYVSLPIGMDLILGKNGYIWITRSIPDHWKAQEEVTPDEVTMHADALQNLRNKHKDTRLLSEDRAKSARLHNAIKALVARGVQVTPEAVLSVYLKSVEMSMEPKVISISLT